MNCTEKQELITRYAMGELSMESREQVEKHLAGCPSCRGELALATRLERILERQPPVTSPPGLVDRIMTAVDLLDRESIEREVITIARERGRWSVRRDILPSLGFAFAAIFISVGLSMWWPGIFHELVILVQEAIRLDIKTPFVTVGGNIPADLNLVISGLMVLSSLFIVLSRMFPVTTRWRDTILPF